MRKLYEKIIVLLSIQNLLLMATTIKSIPVLKEKAAVTFNNKVMANSARRATIDFSAQSSVASRILAKAKL